MTKKNETVRIFGGIVDDNTPNPPEDLLELGKPKALDADIRDELKAWGSILSALSNGLPLPNNPLINLRRLEQAEEATGNDYTDLKKCCTHANEVRDAKDIKPLFFKIMDRIEVIGSLNRNYRK